MHRFPVLPDSAPALPLPPLWRWHFRAGSKRVKLESLLLAVTHHCLWSSALLWVMWAAWRGGEGCLHPLIPPGDSPQRGGEAACPHFTAQLVQLSVHCTFKPKQNGSVFTQAGNPVKSEIWSDPLSYSFFSFTAENSKQTTTRCFSRLPQSRELWPAKARAWFKPLKNCREILFFEALGMFSLWEVWQHNRLLLFILWGVCSEGELPCADVLWCLTLISSNRLLWLLEVHNRAENCLKPQTEPQPSSS